MSGNFFRYPRIMILLLSALLTVSAARAGGITLGGTRIIYPANQKQISMSVRNTSEQSSFLVQSWTEQADGNKSQDFVVTPPLYVSGPGNENTLRLMYVGKPLKTDRETLYYFNAKSVPSLNKEELAGKNILMLAAITRVKLFVRPDGLTPAVDSAPDSLTFQSSGNQLMINNPTPYHITLTKFIVGGQRMPDTMIAPLDNTSRVLPAAAHGSLIKFRTINDFGAVTPERQSQMN